MSGESEFAIRVMRPDQVNIAIEWARTEGWNPGIHDGACHYTVDPDGWFVATVGGVPAATAVTTNYDSDFSFGGFLIVHPDFRGMGLAISRHVLSHVKDRNFGIDGVFAMQGKYQALDGFIPAYRNIR
jgi:GNAT superfamily N-acetyltransferase